MKKNLFIILMLAVFGLSTVVALLPQKVLAAEISGTWMDSATIFMTDDGVWREGEVLRQTFIDPSPGDSNRHFYVRGVNDDEDPNKCADVFKPSSDNTTGTMERWRGSDRDQTFSNCEMYNTAPVSLRLPDNATKPVTASAGESEPTCEDAGGMAWIFCPVVMMLDAAFGWFGQQIEALLEVRDYRNDDLKDAWAVLRNLAYMLIVPAMLIMVIGTALGFEFVSAYTVKKALPRLVIAVIFIALSWEITGFLITMTHHIGAGVRGLILNPFGLQEGFGEVFRPTVMSSIAQPVFVLGFVGLAALSSTVLGILISFLGTAGLILLTIFIFLVARQLFLMALMLFAPLAIIAWIFPGKTRLWNTWWGLFSKLLFIYPIIMAMTAFGLIFGKLLDGNSLSDDTGIVVGGAAALLTPLMKVAAFIIPYALIPLAFKYVGGLVGNLAGMVNDKERGMFDRMKNKRRGMYSRGWKETKAGTLTNRGAPNSRLGRLSGVVGTGLSNAASGPQGWVDPARRAGMRETAMLQAGAEFMETDPTVKANRNDDKFLLALADKQMAMSKRDASTGAERAVWDQSIAKASLVKNQSRSTQMAAAQAWAGSGYNFSQGESGYNELAQVISSASGAELYRDSEGKLLARGPNTGAYGNMMNNAQFNLKQAGRYDLGGINYGGGYNYEAGIDKGGGYQAGQAKVETHIAGAAAMLGGEFVSQDGKTLDGPQFTTKLRERVESGNINLEKLGTHHRNLLDAFNGATGGNKKEIGKQLDAIEAVTRNDQATPSTEQAMNNILAAQGVVEKNRRDAYRGQPQDRAILNEQNKPPEPK